MLERKQSKEEKKEYDVVVVGDLFCDIATKPLRDYPKRDRQTGCEFSVSLGGQAGNCAAACASLGLRTAFFCKCGEDAISAWLLAELRKCGVECFPSRTAGGRPGITVSIAFEDGSRSMLTDRGANLDLKAEDLADLNLFTALRRTKFLMRAGHWNTEGLFEANREMLSYASQHDARTGVDIGWSAFIGWTDFARRSVFEFLPFVDFLFVNEAEVEALSGKPAGGEGERELLRSGCKNVVVHRGERGSAWFCRDFEVECEAFEVVPLHPTGAGDVFNAGFIFALLKGRSPKECLRFGNAAAAVHLQKGKYPKLADVLALKVFKN